MMVDDVDVVVVVVEPLSIIRKSKCFRTFFLFFLTTSSVGKYYQLKKVFSKLCEKEQDKSSSGVDSKTLSQRLNSPEEKKFREDFLKPPPLPHSHYLPLSPSLCGEASENLNDCPTGSKPSPVGWQDNRWLQR